jgi:hypothetical protein
VDASGVFTPLVQYYFYYLLVVHAVDYGGTPNTRQAPLYQYAVQVVLGELAHLPAVQVGVPGTQSLGLLSTPSTTITTCLLCPNRGHIMVPTVSHPFYSAWAKMFYTITTSTSTVLVPWLPVVLVQVLRRNRDGRMEVWLIWRFQKDLLIKLKNGFKIKITFHKSQINQTSLVHTVKALTLYAPSL